MRLSTGPSRESVQRPPARFRWLRRLVVLAAGLMLVAAALPPLTSGPRLGRLVAGYIEADLNHPVRIANLAWGWWGGVTLNGVEAQLDPDSKVSVEQVRVETSLWDILQGRDLRDVYVDGLAAECVVGEPASQPETSRPVATRAAKLMTNRKPGTASPVHSIPVNKVVLSRCSAGIRDVSTGRTLRVALPAAQIDLDRRTGAVQWRVSAKIDDRGLLATEGSFVLPRFAILPADLGGTLQVSWNDMPLAVMPQDVLRRLGLAELAGSAQGQVTLRLSPDWTLAFVAEAGVSDVALRNQQGGRAQASRASAGIVGRFLMIDQRVEVQEAWAQVPGAKIRAAGPALVYDGHHVLRAGLTGTVEDAEVLRSTLSGLGLPLPAALALAGRTRFETHVDRQAGATRVEFGADGAGLAAYWPGVVHREAGLPLEVRALCMLGDDGSVALQQEGRVVLPGGSLTAAAEVASVPSGSARSFSLRQARVSLHWDDLESLAAQWPTVSASLGSLGSVRGPGTVEVRASMDAAKGLAASMAATLPAEADVKMANWLHKPPGRDLRFQAETLLAAGFSRLRVGPLQVDSGGRPLLRVEDVQAQVTKQMLSADAAEVTADPAAAPQEDAMAQRPILLVDLRGTLACLDLSELQAISPLLADTVGRAGGVGGTIRGRTAVSYWADISSRHMVPLGLDVTGELDLERAALRIEGLLDKKDGERLRLAGGYSGHWTGEDGKGHGYGSGSIEGAGFAGQAWYERPPQQAAPSQWVWGWLDIDDIRQATAMLPPLAEVARRDRLDGRMTSRLEWSRQGETFDLRTLLDLTGVQGTWSQAGIRKPSGLPARIDMVVSGPAGDAAGREWRLPKADFTLGESHAGITDGVVEMSEPWAKLLGGRGREALGTISLTWPVRRARAKVFGVTMFGESPVSEDVQTLLSQVEATGPVQWTLDWNYEFPKGLDFAWHVGAGDLVLAAGPLDKPAGVMLSTDVKGRVGLFRDAGNVPHVRLNVTDAAGAIGNLQWKAQGEAVCRTNQGELDLFSAKVTGSGESRDVAELAGLVPAARRWQVKGHAAWEGTFAFEKQKGWRLEDLEVGCWPLEGCLSGLPCRLEGLLNVQQVQAADPVPALRLSATGLAAKLGATQGRFTFDLVREANHLDGEIGTAFEMIDVDELLALHSRLQAGGDKGQPATAESVPPAGDGPPAQAPEAIRTDSHAGGPAMTADAPVPPAEEASGGHGRSVIVAGDDPATEQGPALELAACRLGILGRTEGLRFTHEQGRAPLHLRLLSWEGSLEDGQTNVELVGAFEGGVLTAQVSGPPDGTGPLKIHYRAERAQPSELTRYLLSKSFPGMRVDGPVTLDETLTIDPMSERAAIPSQGEWIVEGGEVTGAAAPASIQRIFPGLQLAKFRFSRLHNWFEKDVHGRTINRMIYRGSPWSMYMNGWSQADGKFRYEIGVDLLGPIESEYWATADRGRVPLFIKTGQVVHGDMHDEVVRYLTPQQIVTRIVKDNLVTIAYEAVRQRVKGGKPQVAASQPSAAADRAALPVSAAPDAR